MSTEQHDVVAPSDVGQGLALVAFAAAAVLVGRGLAPALPGSRSGIEIWITRIETGSSNMPSVGAWLAQLTLLWGSWLCMHLLLSLLNERSIHPVFRAVITIAGSVLFALVALANVAQQQLGEGWLIGIASCAAALGVVGAFVAVAKPLARAAGIVLLLTTVGGLLQVASRLLALNASVQAHAAHFMMARVGATVAFGINAASLLFTLYWVLHRHSGKRIPFALLALTPIAALTWLSLQGSKEGASFLPLLTARTLNELRTHPEPLLLPVVRDVTELSAFAIGLLVLSRPATPAPIRVAVGLAVISQANIDVPLCALLLACAALVSISHNSEISRLPQLR